MHKKEKEKARKIAEEKERIRSNTIKLEAKHKETRQLLKLQKTNSVRNILGDLDPNTLASLLSESTNKPQKQKNKKNSNKEN